MPLSTISNGASSATARANINAIVDQLNNSPSLPLTGGTLTGALINSTNGAASTPVVSLTGTTFTGGTATTTKPTLIVEPTGTTSTGWSTAGTLIGANAATGFTGSLLDLQVAGSAVFQVTSTGAVRGSNYFNSTGIYGMQTSSGGLTTLDVNTTLVVRNANGYSEVFRASGTSLTVGTDLILGRSAPATFQLGVNAASGVNQTIKACNGTAGAGGNLTLAGGTGTTANGNVTLTGATVISGLSLTGAQATNTLDVSTTWNTTGNPTLIYGRVTNTNSGASANLIDIGTVAAGSRLSLDKSGMLSVPYRALINNSFFIFDNKVNLDSAFSLVWTDGSYGGNPSLILSRSTTATLQLGANAASTATAQTIKAHNVTTGVGANLILSGGTGSGGQNGVVIISRLPTSNPGPGILWNNAGTPAIGT